MHQWCMGATLLAGKFARCDRTVNSFWVSAVPWFCTTPDIVCDVTMEEDCQAGEVYDDFLGDIRLRCAVDMREGCPEVNMLLFP